MGTDRGWLIHMSLALAHDRPQVIVVAYQVGELNQTIYGSGASTVSYWLIAGYFVDGALVPLIVSTSLAFSSPALTASRSPCFIRRSIQCSSSSSSPSRSRRWRAPSRLRPISRVHPSSGALSPSRSTLGRAGTTPVSRQEDAVRPELWSRSGSWEETACTRGSRTPIRITECEGARKRCSVLAGCSDSDGLAGVDPSVIPLSLPLISSLAEVL